MLSKKHLFMNISFSFCIFLLYLIFHILTNSPFMLNPLFIISTLLILDIIGAILKNKIRLEFMPKFIFLYDCIAYGITLYLITYDFTRSFNLIALITSLVVGCLFPSFFYPLNKKLYKALLKINVK